MRQLRLLPLCIFVFRESGPVAWTLTGDSTVETRLVYTYHQAVISNILALQVNQHQPTIAVVVSVVQFLRMSTMLRRRLPFKGTNEVNAVKGVTHKVNVFIKNNFWLFNSFQTLPRQKTSNL